MMFGQSCLSTLVSHLVNELLKCVVNKTSENKPKTCLDLQDIWDDNHTGLVKGYLRLCFDLAKEI